MKHIKVVPIRYPHQQRDGTWLLVSTWWLEERVAVDLQAAQAACRKRYGNYLLIVSLGRTHAQQVALKKEKPSLAATPGKSWHEAGLAIDVDMDHLNKLTGSQKASEKFLGEFGWIRTVAAERWHFENHKYWPRADGVVGAIKYIENNHV